MSADYEHPALSFTDPDGRGLRVVRHYQDGIMMMDPSKIIVYEPSGQVVAETEYCRDVIVSRRGNHSIRVFGIDILSSLGNTIWDFDGTGFIDRQGWVSHLLPLLVSFSRRFPWYCIAVFCSVYGIVGLLEHLMAEGFTLPGIRGWFGVVSLGCVFMYAQLSLLVVLLLSLLVALPLARDPKDMLLLSAFYGGCCVVLWLFGCIIRLIPGPHPHPAVEEATADRSKQ